MADARLLELRRKIKAGKPNFHIQNSNDPRKRFAGRWKRPKGLQSKMRERRKGNPLPVEPGYGSPASVKGATQEGLFPFVVHSISDLAKVREGFAAVVSATAGLRKKAQIVKAAAERKLRLLNIDIASFTKSMEESMSSRKEKRQQILRGRKVKAETKKAAESKEAKSQEGIEGKIGDDAKKKAEKAEKDKVLTARDAI